MTQVNQQSDPLLCVDDRRKVFDFSHVHCLKTMSEISRLRSKSILFDVVIRSDGKLYQVNDINFIRVCCLCCPIFVDVGQDRSRRVTSFAKLIVNCEITLSLY